jgi:Holliday junction DNA helicase RuvA
MTGYKFFSGLERHSSGKFTARPACAPSRKQKEHDAEGPRHGVERFSQTMIAHLRGKLISKHPNQAIIEAGGVGYEVIISIPTFSDLPQLGSEVAVFVHTHVREDALALFGFIRAEEKQLFEKLISVSGIGPKLAITILSGMQSDAIVGAIRGNNLAALTRIPGIGKKTAERMVLELRDKLDSFRVTPVVSTATPVEEDVISALVNLGYQRPVAERALAKLGASAGESFDSLFRKTMAALAR